MFTNAKTPQHCELMASHLRNRITVDGAHFELRLHLIYLTNDVLHHWYANPTAPSTFIYRQKPESFIVWVPADIFMFISFLDVYMKHGIEKRRLLLQ